MLTYTLIYILTYMLTYTLIYILIYVLTYTYIYMKNNYYEKVNLNFLKCYIFSKKSFSMVIKIYF